MTHVIFARLKIETLEHLFWLCPKVNCFWKEIASFSKPYVNLDQALCKTSIFLGTKAKGNDKLQHCNMT